MHRLVKVWSTLLAAERTIWVSADQSSSSDHLGLTLSYVLEFTLSVDFTPSLSLRMPADKLVSGSCLTSRSEEPPFGL